MAHSENSIAVLKIDQNRGDLETLAEALQRVGLPTQTRLELSITEALLGLAEEPDRHVLLIFRPS